MKPHKHAELIKAWADGAVIQRKIIRTGENIDEPIISYSWLTENMPMWSIHEEYRIKPEPKPDVVKYVCVTFFRKEFIGIQDAYENNANLAIYFDGETGELKSAEVLK